MIKIINVYKDSRVMEMTTSSNLGLGVKTDNDVDLLRFTFDEMIVGTATLLTTLTDSNGELVAFPLTINQEEKSYDLEVTQYVASELNYTIQIEIVNDDMVWHSKQADITLDECLEIGEGEMPTTVENWLQNANLVMSQYQDKMGEWQADVDQMRADVDEAIQECEVATSGAEKVNVEVVDGQGQYDVTFTDRDGVEHEATIYQGKNAVISGATATINNESGIPSVDVTMGGTESDRTFDFAFHNLKGEKGDKGDKGDAGAIKMQIVDQLPPTGRDDTIYLVPITPDVTGNNYAEYVYINGQWELLGKIGVQVDLTDYVKNTDYATNEKGGVIKFSTNYGVNVSSSSGVIFSDEKTYQQYQNSLNTLFVSKGTLENVITGKGLVSNTDYASSNGGVIKVSAGQGTATNSSGYLIGQTRTYTQYQSDANTLFVCKGTLENVLNARIGDIQTLLDNLDVGSGV